MPRHEAALLPVPANGRVLVVDSECTDNYHLWDTICQIGETIVGERTEGSYLHVLGPRDLFTRDTALLSSKLITTVQIKRGHRSCQRRTIPTLCAHVELTLTSSSHLHNAISSLSVINSNYHNITFFFSYYY